MASSPEIINEVAFYRKKMLLSMIIPGFLVLIMWLVMIVEVLFELDLTTLGIWPLSLKGIPGNYYVSIHPFRLQTFIQ